MFKSFLHSYYSYILFFEMILLKPKLLSYNIYSNKLFLEIKDNNSLKNNNLIVFDFGFNKHFKYNFKLFVIKNSFFLDNLLFFKFFNFKYNFKQVFKINYTFVYFFFNEKINLSIFKNIFELNFYFWFCLLKRE